MSKKHTLFKIIVAIIMIVATIIPSVANAADATCEINGIQVYADHVDISVSGCSATGAAQLVMQFQAELAKGSNYQAQGGSMDSQDAPSVDASEPVTDTDCVRDWEMEAGDVMLVPAGCQLKGDVNVGPSKDGPWTPLYDHDANTGLIVSFSEATWVYAKWGANVTPREIDDLNNEMMESGCGLPKGCLEVIVVHWPDKPADETMATPMPTEEVTCVDYAMTKKEVYLVPAGCQLKGDVRVGQSKDGPWITLHDSDANTGLIVSFSEPTWVYAEWGANVTPRTVDDLQQELMTSGCGSKCNDVQVVHWPDEAADYQ